MKCNQCFSEKNVQDFYDAKNILRKTCSTCREKGQRFYQRNTENQKFLTKKWKSVNEEYVKEMNEFYRTTTSMSTEDRKALKQVMKEKKESVFKDATHFTNDEGIVGKYCGIATCTWRPLTFFRSNEFTSDRLSTICIRCCNFRSKIRDFISYSINTKLKKFLSQTNIYGIDQIHPFLSCSIPFFKKHIESQFKEGMCWEKRAFFYEENKEKKIGWHIDHILPVACFDLTNPRELFLCFHWRNCQPLWGNDNFKKKNKFEDTMRLKYFETMKDQVQDLSAFESIICHIQKIVDRNMDCVEVQPKKMDDKIVKDLYYEYLHDRSLEAVQIMFFINETLFDQKKYTATPLAVMRNHESRKYGSENPRSKKVCQLSLEGEFLGKYESMNIASKENQTFHAMISKCCSHPQRFYIAGGYRWCFEPDLYEVQHRCRFRIVVKQLKQHVRPYENPVVKSKPLPRSEDTKTKIGQTMKTFFQTQEGKQNKIQSFQKRSETMKQRRDAIRESIQEKECRVCKNVLPISSFCKKSASTDGYQPYCKPCVQQKKRIYKSTTNVS